MPLTQLEHYLVLTDDLDATRNFYCNALGMRVGPRPPLDFPGYWLYLREVACIHIADWIGYRTYSEATGIAMTTRAVGTGPDDHIAFNEVNYDSIKARLTQHGIVAAENFWPGAALRQLFLTDPNGVKIELNVPTEGSTSVVDRL